MSDHVFTRRRRLGASAVAGFVLLAAACSPVFRHEVIDARDTGADVKAVADIDLDGDLDVVAGDDSGFPLTWYENPSWRARVIDSRSVFTTDMELGDVDRDGDPDIIVPDYDARTMLWYANPRVGGGSWTPRTIGAADAHDVQIGDQDRDGDLDVIVRGHGGQTTLFVQQSPTSWSSRVLPAPDGEGLGYGDLDADGDLDVAQNGWWLEAPANPLTGTWIRHDFASGWPRDVAAEVADINSDGRNDIVLAASESMGQIAWFQAPSAPRTGTWSARVVANDVGYVHQVAFADVDGDGDRDIAFAEMTNSPQKRVGWIANNSGGTAWIMNVLARTGSHNVRAADIDRDGDPDLIGANYDGTSPIELWRNLRVP